MQVKSKDSFDPRWSAVLSRDRNFDGALFYGVRSTHIYCRPSCPSRKPRREQVSFFFSPEAAEQQGYRACQRCRPRRAEAADPKLKLVRKVCEHIERALADGEEKLNLRSLSKALTISPFHLQRTFKQVTGISPRQYLESRRLDVFKKLIRKGTDVTSAIYEIGYNSSSRIYEKSAAQLGMSPAEYGRQASGQQIRFALAHSSLGTLLLGATDKGICSIKLGDSESELLQEFKDEFAKAQLMSDNASLEPWLQTVLDALEGRCDGLKDLPVDVRTTAFQRRVYEELKRIPAGQTRTYTEVAERLGSGPLARRAVARACATNSVAVVIPCHRVVRADGDLGGYRWGLNRKRELLRREQQGAH
jgi:AraC family transcriptional regulator, regulatory protein of adaptative response / methylated-DNA-[protein]-cysteine methyltransferase